MAMAGFTLCVAVASLASHVAVEASPHGFLARTPALGLDGMSAGSATTLGAEIESLFGKGSISERLPRLEQSLETVFSSLAPEGQDMLDHATSRYALHRYFLARHGWLVSGLDPEGASWNSSSPTEILARRVPEYVKEMFDERLNTGGLNLHSLAVLAATFELLVRGETVSHLEKAYEVMNLEPDKLLSLAEVDEVIEMNKLTDFFGQWASWDTEKLRRVRQNADLVYPGWSDTSMFLRDNRRSVMSFVEREIRNPFRDPRLDFDEVLHVVEASNDEFGHFQDKECQHLKQMLLVYEHRGTGRVPVSKYFGLGRAGHVQFTEPLSYLRHTGLLDEGDPHNPMVIITNWLYSKGNCLGSTPLYSTCCVNECNTIMSQLERQFRAPRIPPTPLAEAVAQISSSTVVAPRNMSNTMMQRLKDIAQVNSGSVPLHGRLFAQWLHHAFPRECPFPHVAHTYTQMSIDDWKTATGAERGYFTAEELRAHGDLLNASIEEDLDTTCWMMDEESEKLTEWNNQEELFLSGWSSPLELSSQGTSTSAVFRIVAMSGAAIGIMAALKQSVDSGYASLGGTKMGGWEQTRHSV